MSDARFYVSSCQMFVFLIFADTRRSILICYKEQVRWVYSEKNVNLCRNLEKVSPLKTLLLNQEVVYMAEI